MGWKCSTAMLYRSSILLPSRPTTAGPLTFPFPQPCRLRLCFHAAANCSSSASSAASSASGEDSPLHYTVRSPQLVELEYSDLNLTDKFSEELGHVRIRQHVNPLRANLLFPAEVPNWNAVFKDPTLPLMVDIGCGSGRFLMSLAKRNGSSNNYLGLEIRQKLAERAKYWVNELALSNIHFIFANAAVSFKELVSSYPGPLMLVSILCPDPHFKKKYHKRRVVQKPLVESIINSLEPNGQDDAVSSSYGG